VAGPDDAGSVLAMLDGAVAWLASTGRSGQWGTEPFSAEPERVAQMRAWAAGGGLRVAEIGGEAAGAMVLGQAPPYVPPADTPELYVLLLVASRAHAGRGVGAALLRHAYAEAVQQEVTRLRVDCWAGGEEALVRYYEAAGVVPCRLSASRRSLRTACGTRQRSWTRS
jgi:GNAT superfamily N-acetyltransferase